MCLWLDAHSTTKRLAELYLLSGKTLDVELRAGRGSDGVRGPQFGAGGDLDDAGDYALNSDCFPMRWKSAGFQGSD